MFIEKLVNKNKNKISNIAKNKENAMLSPCGLAKISKYKKV